MKRIRIKVSGIVQGVGYRAFAKRHAQYMSLTGFVKNNEDGSVTIEVQGKPEVLATFTALMEKGPIHSEIRHISVDELDINEGESLFFVTH